MYCCKLCQDNKTKSWASRNPKKYKDKNKNGHLKHYHGFSLEDFKELSKKQKHRCAICKKKTKLFVDHKHKSKPRKIRGLLCPNCNFAIGQFKDSSFSKKCNKIHSGECMSEELTVLKPQSLAVMGGVGLGSAIFKTRPATIELVPRTTRQTGAIPGTFRNMMTNEVIGITDEEGKVVKNEFKAVLLAVPQPQREWYKNDGKTFSADMKQCFSLDNVQPHPKAKNPPAMFCATCPKGDINWQKWRDGGRTPDLLPQCQMYYHLVLAEHNSQQRYYMNVKGKSVKQFRDAMEMQMGPLLEKMAANVVMINRSRGYKLNKNTGQFDFVD